MVLVSNTEIFKFGVLSGVCEYAQFHLVYIHSEYALIHSAYSTNGTLSFGIFHKYA